MRYDQVIVMEHLQIAYDLLVIMIGLAALAIVGVWAFKTGEVYLRDFCVVYAMFTLVLVITVLKKYLFLNVAGYSARSWYVISGIDQAFHFAVIVAAIHFFLRIYEVRHRKVITVAVLLVSLVCYGLIWSPLGAVLDAEHKTIRFGVGYQIAAVWYFVSFTFALALGYGLLRRIWQTDKRNFVLGLLIFATIGYGETLVSLPQMLRTTEVTL